MADAPFTNYIPRSSKFIISVTCKIMLDSLGKTLIRSEKMIRGYQEKDTHTFLLYKKKTLA
jgi:hypothetical protein